MNSFRPIRFVWFSLLIVCGLWSGPSSVRAQSTHETIASVTPRMVKIFGAGGIQRLQGYCSGFVVSPNGHIVTIWSHVLDEGEVTVVLESTDAPDPRLMMPAQPL